MGFTGFPFKSFPRGWYQVAWSHELIIGEVKPLKYFGRDLVMYRGESGKVFVLHAFCRHMGAHLGHGGKVCGDDIACPFHGWRWNGQGSNTEIPYSRQNSIPAKLRHWTTAEVSGMIMVWYHEEGQEPDVDPPARPKFDDPDYYPVYPHGLAIDEVPFPPQVMVENAVDWPHLIFVHKWDVDVPKVLKIEDRGRTFYVESEGALETGQGIANVRLAVEAWSVGLTYVELFGIRDMSFVVASTPIDESHSVVRLSIGVKRKKGDMGDTPDRLGMAMIQRQVTEVLGNEPGSDRNIWEHMEYQTNPALVREEVSGWRALRNWTTRFYSDQIKPAPVREMGSETLDQIAFGRNRQNA